MARKATPATPATPATEQATTEQVVDAVVVPVPAATPADEAKALKAFRAVTAAEQSDAKAVARVKAEGLPATVKAWHAFGLSLKPIIDAAEGLAWESVTSTGLFTAIGKGTVVSAATRAAFPQQAQSFGKALTLAKSHDEDRLAAFLKAGNVPDSDEYVIWLNLLANGKAGSNRSTIDLVETFGAANVDVTGDKPVVKPGSTPGLIVRGATPGGRGSGASLPAVPAAVAKVLKVRDSAAKMLDAAPTVADLSWVPAEKWDAFVAQVLREACTRALTAAPAAADASALITPPTA